MIPTLLTPPGEYPVTLAELRRVLRLGQRTDRDDELTSALAAAVEEAQAYAWRQFCPATYELALPAFYAETIELPRPPLLSVESITYLDGNRVRQTLDAATYEVEAGGSEHGRIYPAYGQSWPTTACHRRAVVITFRAGYGPPEKVPAQVREALQLLVEVAFEHRTEGGLSQAQPGTLTWAAARKLDQVAVYRRAA